MANENTEEGLKRVVGVSGLALTIVGFTIGAGIFAAKASFGVFVQVWLRWTLPRLRIDQVMTTGYCRYRTGSICCF